MTDELTVMAREVATKLSKYDGIKSADFVIAKDEVTLNCEVRGWGTVSSSHWHGWFSQYCNELGTDWVAEVCAREIERKVISKLWESSYFRAINSQINDKSVVIDDIGKFKRDDNQVVPFVRIYAKDNSYFVDVTLDDLLLCSVKEAAERLVAFVNSEKVQTDLANAQVAFKRLFERYGFEITHASNTFRAYRICDPFLVSHSGRKIAPFFGNLVGMSGMSADKMFDFLDSKVSSAAKQAIFEAVTDSASSALVDGDDSDKFLLEMSKAVSSVAALS